MASLRWYALNLLALVSFLSAVDCLAEGNCSERLLRTCKERFDENSNSLCGEVIELQECLFYLSDCDHSKHFELQYLYRALHYKVYRHSSCITGELVKKKCNETLAQACLELFNRNATPICPEVKKLRRCIDRLKGCHVMKHPSFTLSQSILTKHRKCFILVVNYSRILEVLVKKTGLPKPINSTEAPTVVLIETSNFLPYTFVVVATVCTCLFLVILVVFSVVRHTSLLRNQRQHSTVERAPTRLRTRSRRSSQRNRTNSRRHSWHGHRRHNFVIQGARETVSGFFEGNVPPPPYSAVLDETESLRAGDPPPPYQSSTFVSIGVIV